jgi:alpha-galactosidase
MTYFGSRRFRGVAAGLILFAATLSFPAPISSHNASAARGGEIRFQSDLITVRYHARTGTMDVAWQDGRELRGITSAAQLGDGQQLSSSQYRDHTLVPAADANSSSPLQTLAPKTHEYTIRNSGPGMPDLLQHVWLYDGKPELVIQAELGREASIIGTRHFDAVILKGREFLRAGNNADLRVLHVPFDNDMWFRYDSMAAADMKAGERYSSDEVTTIYNNESRQGFVMGSVTHDIWKTTIDVHADNGQLTDLDIYGGISSPTGVSTDTHDSVPHGLVHGPRVLSPAVFIGSFADWRDGLEAYGQANAMIHPPLAWPEGRPMGWNSWAAYADKINHRRYLGAAEFVRDKLVPQGFERNKVVYINLDAFWSALDAVQLADAVANIKAMQGADGVHFKPGIYWTPFAYWSDDLDAYVEGTGMKYRYRDILLKAPDGSYLPKVDGGRAIDPSHPGTKARTAFYLSQFQRMGFQYLKLDFLSHGTLEGAHYDPQIQTGIEAYNLGMQQIVEENQNRMFLSLSIAPLFPGGYGHARRLSCDTKGHISGGDQSTEYMLNSLTYGWWTDKNLYIADPDHVVLGPKADQGARTLAEGQSRFLSAVISGGMILDSSRLADDPEGQELATAVYNNRNLFRIASEQKAFRPVEGDTGNKATNIFVRLTEHGYYIALFNFDEKNPQRIHLALERISPELANAKAVSVKDVASEERLSHVQHDLSIDLQPSSSKLIELSPEE